MLVCLVLTKDVTVFGKKKIETLWTILLAVIPNKEATVTQLVVNELLLSDETTPAAVVGR